MVRCPVDGEPLFAVAFSSDPADSHIGQIIGERYRVDRIVGRGGMGVVFGVTHTTLDKPFAMKVLRLGLHQSMDAAERFMREARAASAIQSPHVVNVFDFGTLPDGALYCVMDLLAGQTLVARLRGAPMTDAELLHVFEQVAATLALAHDAGIIHRDLKPDNIFLVNEQNDPLFVKVLDFGVAKIATPDETAITKTGLIIGTPFYMSPEQARGESVDRRSDVYSLGVMMYRAFTGKLPFESDTREGVMTKHIQTLPVAPGAIANVSPGIERLILRCMEKAPENRFSSMRELVSEIQAMTNGKPMLPPRQSSTPPPSPGSPLAMEMPQRFSAPAPSSPPRASGTRRLLGPLVFGAIVSLGALSAVGIVFVGQADSAAIPSARVGLARLVRRMPVPIPPPPSPPSVAMPGDMDARAAMEMEREEETTARFLERGLVTMAATATPAATVRPASSVPSARKLPPELRDPFEGDTQ